MKKLSEMYWREIRKERRTGRSSGGDEMIDKNGRMLNEEGSVKTKMY